MGKATLKNILMKNIVLDCERTKYADTGLFHYCINLGSHLKKHIDSQNEKLSFYTPPSVQNLFSGTEKNIIQNSLHKFFMPSLKEYDIWHATYQDSYYIPFLNKKIKVVLTIHDLNFLYDASKSKDKKQKCLNRLQKLINRADVIVCVSEYCKKDVLLYCDTNNKAVHVIYNGTNTLQNPLLYTKSYKPAKPFIFSLGTITRKKNFHSLLSLININRTLELVIAGRPDDADYYNQIMKTTRLMGIQDNVHLLGQISEGEKSWYFKNCRAFAFPSISEGFGLPVAEAMSFGKPLFLSNKTALPEIGGKVAFYFKDFSETIMQQTFESGMKEYYNSNMKNDIIKKGEEFCWDNAAHEYLKIYREL
jgi:glycosyltransferase involved in cell wall biosynthesis